VDVLPLDLGQPIGFLGLHSSVLLLAPVVGRLSDLDGATDIGNGHALSDQLLSGLELADDLLGCVGYSFHGGDPGPVLRDEDSRSPWNIFWEPCQQRVRGLNAQLAKYAMATGTEL